jgi:catechol 2,3-dioxygenase-like lactoylglutathione lyase family enzyme
MSGLIWGKVAKKLESDPVRWTRANWQIVISSAGLFVEGMVTMGVMTIPSAPDYGRSLSGFGVNLIVNDLARSVSFAAEVLGAKVFFQKEGFAAMRLSGQNFMFHAKETYRGNALHGTLEETAPKGIGVELRCYEADPDAAEAKARDLGYTVLAGSIDKPHGLRECVILDDEGFAWLPSRRLKDDDART